MPDRHHLEDFGDAFAEEAIAQGDEALQSGQNLLDLDFNVPRRGVRRAGDDFAQEERVFVFHADRGRNGEAFSSLENEPLALHTLESRCDRAARAVRGGGCYLDRGGSRVVGRRSGHTELIGESGENKKKVLPARSTAVTMAAAGQAAPRAPHVRAHAPAPAARVHPQ